jgi:putative ABC transport system permease protein
LSWPTIALRWAWEQVRPRLGQISLAIVVIAFGVALAGGVLLANGTLQRAFQDSVDALAGRAQIQIGARGGGAFDESILETVRTAPGVAFAAPLLQGTAFLRDAEKTPLRILAVDMLDDATVRLYHSTPTESAGIEEPLVFLSQPGSVIVTSAFLARHGFKSGDSFDAQTAAGFVRLTIRGVLKGGGVGLAFGGNLAIMDLYAAQDVLDFPRSATQIDVVATEGADIGATAQALRDLLPHHLEVEEIAARRERLAGSLSGFQLLFDMIAASSLLLGSLIIANRLATTYEERRWELGLVRSLGMSPRELLGRLMTEAMLVTAIGVALGLPMAIAFAQLVVGPLATAMTLNFRQEVAAPWVEPQIGPLAVAALAGMTSGLLAAWLPARRSTRSRVADVLKNARSRKPEPESATRRRMQVVLPALGAASIALLVGIGDRSGILGGLAIVSVGAAGATLLQPCLRLVSAPLGKLFGGATAVALDDQSIVPGRALGAATVLMFGCAIVVFVNNTGRSFEHFVVDTTTGVRRADLVVDSSANAAAMGEGEPRLADDAIAEIGRIEGVDVVAADVAASASDPDTGILAVEPVWLRRPEFGDWQLEEGALPDALERVARGEAFLVNFPPDRSVRVGDTVRLMTPSGPLERPAAAIHRASCLNPKGDVVMSRLLYKEYWRDSTINRMYILIDDGASAGDVAAAIRERLAERWGLRVMPGEALAEWFASSVRRGFAIADAMGLLALLVVLLGTADALAASVVERTRDIATMRSLGCSPYLVGRMVLAQAVAVGIVGSVLGLVVGLGWSVAFVRGIVPPLLGWTLQLRVPGAVLATAAALGISACLAGALYPAIRAGRLRVVEALRYE